MLVSFLPATAFAQLADAELFDFSEGKINAYYGDDVVNLEIPAEINNSSVTAIGERAFNEHDEISILTIPEGVESVTSIGDCAFRGCTTLTTVVIPSTVTEIGETVFAGCESLTDIYLNWTESIPEGITPDTFGLTSPEGVTIHIPEGLDQSNPQLYIGYQAAFGIELAEGSYVLPEFEIDESGVITGYNGAGGSVTIPAKIGDTDVTAIGEKVFESCQTLTGVTIPAGVTSIGKEAFCNCQYQYARQKKLWHYLYSSMVFHH